MPQSCFTENVLPPLNNLVVPRDQGHGQSGDGSGDSEGINRVVAT
jgi:hypothetical protein